MLVFQMYNQLFDNFEKFSAASNSHLKFVIEHLQQEDCALLNMAEDNVGVLQQGENFEKALKLLWRAKVGYVIFKLEKSDQSRVTFHFTKNSELLSWY